MSEINNVGYTRLAVNNLKCNHLMPLNYKWLNNEEDHMVTGVLRTTLDTLLLN